MKSGGARMCAMHERSEDFRMRTIAGLMVAAISAAAQGQVLIGSTTTTAGQASIVEINPGTGAVRVIMTVTVPAGYEV